MKSLFLLTLMVVVVGTAGCHTMRGVGEDVESAGEGLKHAVDKND